MFWEWLHDYIRANAIHKDHACFAFGPLTCAQPNQVLSCCPTKKKKRVLTVALPNAGDSRGTPQAHARIGAGRRPRVPNAGALGKRKAHRPHHAEDGPD